MPSTKNKKKNPTRPQTEASIIIPPSIDASKDEKFVNEITNAEGWSSVVVRICNHLGLPGKFSVFMVQSLNQSHLSFVVSYKQPTRITSNSSQLSKISQCVGQLVCAVQRYRSSSGWNSGYLRKILRKWDTHWFTSQRR